MAKNKTSRIPNLPTFINERSVFVILAIVLTACSVVLIMKENREKTNLIEPVVNEQPAGQ